jgi:hypothetical protein
MSYAAHHHGDITPLLGFKLTAPSVAKRVWITGY